MVYLRRGGAGDGGEEARRRNDNKLLTLGLVKALEGRNTKKSDHVPNCEKARLRHIPLQAIQQGTHV